MHRHCSPPTGAGAADAVLWNTALIILSDPGLIFEPGLPILQVYQPMYQRVVVAAPIRRKRPEMLELAEYPSLSAIYFSISLKT
jgi:hypothetical protein